MTQCSSDILREALERAGKTSDPAHLFSCRVLSETKTLADAEKAFMEAALKHLGPGYGLPDSLWIPMRNLQQVRKEMEDQTDD